LIAALRSRHGVIAAVAIAIIAAGAALSRAPVGRTIWMVGLIATGAPIVWRTLAEARRGRWATDVVAVLAIVGAVLLQQPLAGLVIVVMRSGGEAIEQYAAGRASAALRELENAAPRIAHRLVGTQIVDVPASDVQPGDVLLVRPGDLVPCDCIVIDGHSLVDASRLTGEPVPVSAAQGTHLLSGSINADGALTVRALAGAAESQYARIVEMVRTAQESKAPIARLADRYAVWFAPFTLGVCGVVYVLSHDWVRVLAVLVVATPCPLILATPIAIVGGINRAARRQIIIRHGGALEALSTVDTVVLDKTGTVTIGKPAVSRTVGTTEFTGDQILRLAGAVEQGSSHLLARTTVDAALARFGSLPAARHHVESPGRGVSADVDGREVIVGAQTFVGERVGASHAQLDALDHDAVALRAYVAVDGALAGFIEYADSLRPGLAVFFADLRRLGVRRTLLLSGDHAPNVRAVAKAVGIAEARGDLLPADKVTVVRQLAQAGAIVLMVGDGTNDAPALSTAHVGIALASAGGGISAEAADVVLLADELPRVAEAIAIGQRTMRIARQSIWVGLVLSATAMYFAGIGVLAPTVGALLQEVIDVATIANALRSSSAGGTRKRGDTRR
jgi:heavy metal translocating P-type ATPase